MKLKRILALVLCFAMVLSTMSFPVFATETTAVVKIGETPYETLDAALAAAKDAGGTEVEITVVGDIKLSTAIGDFTKVTFTGTNREQTIDMNLGAAIDVNTELVFNDLTISRLDSDWLYHYTYIRGGLTYNNCKMIGLFNVTAQDTDFIGCDFYNDDTFGDGNYSLWLYNCADGVEVNITNCTFDVYERAIKIWADGYSGEMTLNINNTDFKSRTVDKTVVEMAYANSTGVGSMTLNIDDESTATGFGAPEHIKGETNAWFNVESTDATETVSTVKVDNEVVYTDVEPAGPVEVATFDELVEALTNGGEIKLTADITTTAAITTSGITATIDLNGKTLTIGAGDNKFNDASDITIKNGNVVITGVTVNGNAIFCLDEYEETLVTTLTLDDINLTGNGYSSAYGIFYIGDSSVLNVNGGEWNLTNDTFAAGGVFKADDAKATLNIDGLDLTAHNVRRVVTYADTTIANSTMTITGDADGVDAEMEHGFNRSPLSITNSTITMKDMVGRGITAECGAVSISSNSIVTITNAQEATIDVRENQTVTVDSTSTVTIDAEPTITSGTVSGVTVSNRAATVTYADGSVKYYTTLTDAVNAACVATGKVTLTLAYDVVEDVTVTEKVGLYLTIEGSGKTLNGTITINALSDANDNRRTTIQNLNFVDTDDSASVTFIKSNETNHYPRITVKGCTFTGSGYEDDKDEDVAINLKSAYDAEIRECTGTGLHSFLQNTSGVEFYIYKVTVTDSNSGLAMGTAQNVTIRGCNIKVNNYGIRLDAVLDTSVTLNGNVVNSYIPVSIRKATATEYKLTFSGSASSYTETNTDDVWCAICATEYEAGVALNKATGNVKITWNTSGLDKSGVYGAYEWPIEIVFDDDTTMGFDSLSSAMSFGSSKTIEKIVVHQDITEKITSLAGNITTDNPNGVTITNTYNEDDWVYCGTDNFTIGEGVTFNSPTAGLFVYGDNCVIKGTVNTDAYYQRYADSKLTIYEPGSLNVSTETFIVRYMGGDSEAGIYIVGDNNDETIGLNAQVIYFYQGMINAKDANINVGTYWQTNTTDNEGTASLVLDNSKMTVTVDEHNFKATGNSRVAVTNGSSLKVANGFEIGDDTMVYVDETSTVTDKNGEVNFDSATPVAKIGNQYYATLADALTAAQDGDTVTLLWNEGDDPIAMNGSVYGKTVTITGTATVDWSKGWLFVGRGGEGDGKLIFSNAQLTAAANGGRDIGIHVSGATSDSTKNDGVLVITDGSNIELDWLVNRNEVIIDGNSTLTVVAGLNTHGRNAEEAESGEAQTATLTVKDGSTLTQNKYTVTIGKESYGILNIEGTVNAPNMTVNPNGTVNVKGGTLVVDGTLKTNKNLFISGESTVKVENLDGRATVMDDTTLTDSYIKSTTNGTTRVLGDLTLNGGFATGYFMTAGSNTDTSGYSGTITIEDDATVDVSYGVEFNGDVTLNGGTIDLSGGNANGELWGFVFQSGTTATINSDIVVDGNGDATPIHFTNATATVNGSISQSNSGGEPIYISYGSKVTVSENGSITTDCAVFVNADSTLKSSGDITGTIKKNADTAVIEITGGTYTQDVSEWCVTGYMCEDNGDGTYGVVLASAIIGNIGYKSLAQAVTAAQSGDTIILMKDVALTESIKVTDTVTVDLNGKKLTGPDDGKANWYAFIVDGGDLTLKDSVGTGELWAKCYGVETKSGSFTMESGTITATNNATVGTAIVNYGGTVTVKGGTLNGTGAFAAIHTAGYFANAATEIKGGTIDGVVSVENYAEKSFAEIVSSASADYALAEGYTWTKKADEDVYVAASERSITVSAWKPSVVKGEEVTIAITLGSGEDIANGSWTLTYDPNKFTLKDSEDSTGVINDYKSKEHEGEVYKAGEIYKTYTFIAKAVDKATTGDFVISNTKASTWVESFEGVKVDAKNNEKATVAINMIDYTVKAYLGENEVSETGEITYNGDAHDFVVKTDLADNVNRTITYKVNGGEKTDKVSVTDAGTYTIEYEIITEDGYENKTGKVTITVLDPEFEVEVLQWTNMGKRIVLVHTMQDDLYFTYNNNLMIDVSVQENYTFNDTKYNHVFAFVTESLEEGDEAIDVADYKANIKYMSDGTGVFKIKLYDSDINYTDDLDVQDITTEFGVANLHSVLYGKVKYQKQILKADTNGSKNVDGADTGKVVADVKAALGIK